VGPLQGDKEIEWGLEEPSTSAASPYSPTQSAFSIFKHFGAPKLQRKSSSFPPRPSHACLLSSRLIVPPASPTCCTPPVPLVLPVLPPPVSRSHLKPLSSFVSHRESPVPSSKHLGPLLGLVRCRRFGVCLLSQ